VDDKSTVSESTPSKPNDHPDEHSKDDDGRESDEEDGKDGSENEDEEDDEDSDKKEDDDSRDSDEDDDREDCEDEDEEDDEDSDEDKDKDGNENTNNAELQEILALYPDADPALKSNFIREWIADKQEPAGPARAHWPDWLGVDDEDAVHEDNLPLQASQERKRKKPASTSVLQAGRSRPRVR